MPVVDRLSAFCNRILSRGGGNNENSSREEQEQEQTVTQQQLDSSLESGHNSERNSLIQIIDDGEDSIRGDDGPGPAATNSSSSRQFRDMILNLSG